MKKISLTLMITALAIMGLTPFETKADIERGNTLARSENAICESGASFICSGVGNLCDVSIDGPDCEPVKPQ
ncbi:hypothetical protein [Roseivirga spongicola]|nr:hypothetical protein [Roseivirga spongicola]